MSELLREFRVGQLNFEDTLEKVYGIDLITLDNMWRESLGVPPVSMERIGNRPDSTTPTPIPTRAPSRRSYGDAFSRLDRRDRD